VLLGGGKQANDLTLRPESMIMMFFTSATCSTFQASLPDATEENLQTHAIGLAGKSSRDVGLGIEGWPIGAGIRNEGRVLHVLVLTCYRRIQWRRTPRWSRRGRGWGRRLGAIVAEDHSPIDRLYGGGYAHAHN
jgi:hypothetical protein